MLPLAGRLLRNGWREVGDFLGGSIRDFWQRHPLERQLEWWHAAGLHGVEVRRLSLGGAVVIWGRKTMSPPDRAAEAVMTRAAQPVSRPAWYALERGGWRDYVTLLHPPYTAWHLSYVVIGGCLAPVVAWDRLGAVVVAFALAVGVGAHALDELNGRPLRTKIPDRVLVALAGVSIVGRLRDRRRGRG